MNDTRYYWLISTCLVTSSVIALAANSFLLLVFCRRRGLRTVSNRFVINLLIINLLSSLLLTPLLLVDQATLLPTQPVNETTKRIQIANLIIEEDRIFNQHSAETIIIEHDTVLTSSSPPPTWPPFLLTSRILCTLNRLIARFVSTLSIFSILLIGINQYFGVIHSLRYHFYINKTRSTVAILTIWFTAILIAIGDHFTHFDCVLFVTCGQTISTNQTFDICYAVVFTLLVIAAPLVAISAIYVRIYTAAHRNSERMRKSTSTNFVTSNSLVVPVTSLPKVRSAPNFAYLTVDTPSPAPPPSTFMTTLKHKLSNASGVFRQREETRAAKITFLVIFLVIFGHVPYGVASVAGQWLPPCIGPISLVLLVASNAISPFLFAYRNRRVRREIGRVLGVKEEAEGGGRREEGAEEERRVPFLNGVRVGERAPEVCVSCSCDKGEGGEVSGGRRSILKRVCEGRVWNKKCNFMQVPDGCLGGGEARGSFSSASTQISNED